MEATPGTWRSPGRHPATMIASDGDVIVFGRAHPHPRSYGAFARVLSEYVGKRGVLTLEEGVRKMTAFRAQRIGLLYRGVLRPGMRADVVVFDPARRVTQRPSSVHISTPKGSP